jgi:hypothetical protein
MKGYIIKSVFLSTKLTIVSFVICTIERAVQAGGTFVASLQHAIQLDLKCELAGGVNISKPQRHQAFPLLI